ncbi:MAG: crossover junction endodeoxyribonuclease RuvC, partial [Saprospiraceae bacterium]|nr:crossover junction endodeoxyribonuclease RuvC [Saprospiraceae bacterium]
MLKLGRAQGVAIAAGVTKKLKITEYSPKKVKQSVTGNGNASKEQVAAMVDSILGKIPNPTFDATDAAAVALCHYYQGRGPSVKGKKYSGWESFIKENPSKVGS